MAKHAVAPGKVLLDRIGDVLNEMHCSGCIADMHCDFSKRHVECLAKIKDILSDYEIRVLDGGEPIPVRVREVDFWQDL